MSLYPSLEDLKLSELARAQLEVQNQNENPSYMAICPSHPSGMDQQSLNALYPVLKDYMGMELETLAKNSVAVSGLSPSAQVTNGVRKLILCKDGKGQIGLKLSAINNGIFVSVIVKDSPASIAGLRFGDQVLQINETFVAGMSVDKVHKMFKNCPSNNINVIIRDRPLERSIMLYKDQAGKVGFQFKNGKINTIVKDSSAASNGVLTDHQLLEINGQNVVGMKDKDINEIISKTPDTITITIIPVSIYEHMIKNISPSLIKNIMDHSAI